MQRTGTALVLIILSITGPGIPLLGLIPAKPTNWIFCVNFGYWSFNRWNRSNRRKCRFRNFGDILEFLP